MSDLLNYAKSGNFEQLEKLLNEGREPNVKGHGMTPLLWACHEGHEGCVTLLLDHGANIEVQSEDGWTPLHYACFNGHEGCVTLLLDHGANVEVQSDDGWTPLLLACQYGHEGCVTLLLDHGANMEIQDNSGYTLFIWHVRMVMRDV